MVTAVLPTKSPAFNGLLLPRLSGGPTTCGERGVRSAQGGRVKHHHLKQTEGRGKASPKAACPCLRGARVGTHMLTHVSLMGQEPGVRAE